MSREELERSLVAAIEPGLADVGFSYLGSRGLFSRGREGINQRIAPVLTKRKSSDFWVLGFHFGIRFDPIEELLNKYRPYVLKREAKHTATLAAHSLNVFPTSIPVDAWTFRSAADVRPAVESILDALRRYGIPFLEHHSDLCSLQEVLESKPTESHMDFHKRPQVLLAIYSLSGDYARIRQVLPGMRQTMAHFQHGFFSEQFDHLVAGLAEQFPGIRS